MLVKIWILHYGNRAVCICHHIIGHTPQYDPVPTKYQNELEHVNKRDIFQLGVDIRVIEFGYLEDRIKSALDEISENESWFYRKKML